MSIKVTCPSGHQLKLKEKYAGQTGLCPKCQARIYVPDPNEAQVTEDSVVDMLGPPMHEEESLPVHQESRHRRRPGDSASGTGQSGTSLLGAETFTCPKCRKVVSTTYHICPHCWTYFADMVGSSINKKVRFACPQCGVDVVPGDAVCGGCGLDLRPA